MSRGGRDVSRETGGNRLIDRSTGDAFLLRSVDHFDSATFYVAELSGPALSKARLIPQKSPQLAPGDVRAESDVSHRPGCGRSDSPSAPAYRQSPAPVAHGAKSKQEETAGCFT